jgi:hypothetical protein
MKQNAILRSLFLILILILVLPASATETKGASPAFSRTEDPIVITGEKLQPFLGQEISRLGLFVAKADKLAPIPFQIDKKDKNGQYILEMNKSGDKWQKNPQLPSPSKLEKNDEITFRARDLGEKVSPDKWPTPSGLEIEITDPINQAKAFTYLFAFPSSAPRSPADYIEFTPEPSLFRSDEITYGFTDPKHPALINYIAFGRDPKSPTLLDRFKMRMGISIFFGKFKVEKNEEDIKVRLLAYTDGPLRVIILQEFAIDIMSGIKSPWVKRVSISYPNRIEFPNDVYIPFRPGLVISEAHATATFDFSENVSGSILYHPALPAPLAVDGAMSPAELNAPPEYAPWCALAGKAGAFVETLKYDDRIAKANIKKTFFYRDDSAYRDQYEYEPGSFGEMGMKITGMEKLTGGTYQFTFALYGRKNFQPGDEKEFLQIESKPLEVKVNSENRN